ncbi:MAG: ABC transporter permease [Gemmatimonadetes bacterium]|nr:ABC transporter permease [Gemmatimonadota bacterium]
MLAELWSDLRYRARALFRRAEVERDLDEELGFHIEREAEKYMAMGVARDEALRRARLAFGGVDRTKERSREVRGTLLLETLVRDARYAVRSLARAPGFTLVAVLCLALGIGATGTVFGIVDVLFFRPPDGVPDPGAIVRPYITVKGAQIFMDGSTEVSYPTYVTLRDQTRSLSGLAGYGDVVLSVGSGPDARREDGLVVTGNYFTVLGVRPALGRFFTPAEDAGPGSPPAVVVSWAYWQGALGGKPGAIGSRLVLDGHAYTIVGVAPRGFHGIDAGAPSIWVPVAHVARLGFAPDELERRTSWWLSTVGRLAPGVTRAQAQAELAPLITRALRADWGDDIQPRIVLGPVLAAHGPSPSRQARIARWLALAAALLLAIACANTANLLLARGVTRRKELALRLSVGASRARVVRQLLTESAVLALAGTALGLLLARGGTALLPAVGLPALSFFAQGRVLGFAVAVAAACVLLFGLAPAVAVTRGDLADATREGARAGVDHRSRLRGALMVAQIALATLLLVGAGLFVRSLRNVQAIRPGVDVDRLLVGSVDLATAGYGDTAAAAFFDRAVDRLRHVPGVRDVTLASYAPLSGGLSATAYSVPDGTSGASATIDLQQSLQGARAITMRVGPRYFATVGTPILAGRDFTDHDATGEPVVIVNRAFAEHEWPGRSALGRCVDIGWKQDVRCYRVVGVAADARYVGLEEPRRMVFFQPIQRDPEGSRVLLIRAERDPAALAPAVRRALADLDPRLPYVELKPLTDVLRPQLQPRRLGASMFGAFGLLALLLAAVGLYGVVSYTVAQRTHELGVRMALGARRAQVLRLVVRQGVRLALVGLLIGAAGAFAVTRFVTHLLYGVTATDPLTFAGVALVLAGAAVLASLVPAHRATRVDPVIALRGG